MASSSVAPNNPIEPKIKHESPYNSPSPAHFAPHSPLSSSKRRRSIEDADLGEKRQKINDNGSLMGGYNDEEFQAMLAAATMTATQEFAAISSGIKTDQSPIPEPNPDVSRHKQDAKVDYLTEFSTDPHIYMRIFSLPILESLSTQILSTIAQGPYATTIQIVQGPNSELGQAYQTLKSLFEQTKKIYTQKAPFLSTNELNIRDPGHRETIRITNLATFASGVFEGNVGFYELSDNFVPSFAANGCPLGQEPCELYLNLKTQMYLSAVSTDEQEQTKEELLDLFFQENLGDVLQLRHPDQPLSQAELWFVEANNSRREYLMNASSNVESIKMLSERFPWEDFLRDLSAYLKTSYEALLPPYLKRHSLSAPSLPDHTQPTNGNGIVASIEDDPFAIQTNIAVQEALRAFNAANAPTNYSGGLQQQDKSPAANNGRMPQSINDTPPADNGMIPTMVLYEKARQQAAQKSNPQQKRPGISQRRPWTEEEEKALMSGLDAVRGPHWSQILALYGENGTISNVLKDRNQVQLKDKARNLKLFFLKSDIGVPPHLQAVTGELKTRAPTQAARKEADLRQRAAEDGTAGPEEESPQPNSTGSSKRPLSRSESSRRTPELERPEMLHVVAPDSASPEMVQALPVQPQRQVTLPRPMNEDEVLRDRLMGALASSKEAFLV